MLPHVIFLLALAQPQAVAASPEALVNRFCAVYMTQKEYGLLEGKDRKAMAPFLSTRLLKELDDAVECQKDWFRQQPKDTTDKPPFVDCCLFSSTPDGMPTSYELGPVEPLPDGRAKVVIAYHRKTKVDDIRWRDAVIVAKEDGRHVIDDVVYDVDAQPPQEPFYLSTGFEGCQGTRWVE